MEPLPLRFWMPGDRLDTQHRDRVVSVFYSGHNFAGVLMSMRDADTWSVWTVNVHGVPSEVRQAGRDATARDFRDRVVKLVTG